MKIYNNRDLGGLVRQRRSDVGLTQKTLAAQIGVSREWLSELERGRSHARIDLVFRALGVLGISLEPHFEPLGESQAPAGTEMQG